MSHQYAGKALERQLLDISEAEYRQLPAVSSSGLRLYATEGPMVYRAAIIDRTIVRNQTDPMRLGTAFHRAMDDKTAWDQCYAIIPTELEDDESLAIVKADWSGKKSTADLSPGAELNLKFPAHRQYLELRKQVAASIGKDWVTDDEVATIRQQIEAVYDNPACIQYLGEGAETESPYTAIDQETRLPIKCLCDRLVTFGERRVVVDFKTTSTRTPYQFFREGIRGRGYDKQGEMYLRVTGADAYILIAVSSEAPFESLVYTLEDTLIVDAKSTNDAALQKLQYNYEFNGWHSEGWGAEIPLTSEGVGDE